MMNIALTWIMCESIAVTEDPDKPCRLNEWSCINNGSAGVVGALGFTKSDNQEQFVSDDTGRVLGGALYCHMHDCAPSGE